jgi:glycosyltransferase involved in cell wall biosynthesis
MRILFISTFYPPYIIGGWEQLVEDLNLGLRERGHETLVLTTSHGVPAGLPLIDPAAGVDRSLLLESNLQFYEPAAMFTYRRRTEHNLGVTRAAIERFRPDVIFVHIMWNLSRGVPWLAEQLLPGRVVYYVADHWAYSPDPHETYWRDGAGDSLRTTLKRALAPLALGIVGQDRKRFHLAFARVLCVSEAIRQSMLAHLPLDPQRVQVVHNGIDLGAFPFQARQLSGSANGLRLLYAGSLVPHKGVHVAVDAIGELARQGGLAGDSLTIVGSGRPDYESWLRRAVAEQALEEHVQFVGRVARSEMPGQLAAHDVLIFPSEWPEPLARMTQEAMASGAVVVGTITGGTGEILVDGETGLVFPPGDAPALARCIRRLQLDPSLFNRLAHNARRRVEEKFSFVRMLDQVDAALGEMVAAARPLPGGVRS